MRSEDRWKRPPAIEGEGEPLRPNAAMLPAMFDRCNRSDMQILAASVTTLAIFGWPTGEVRKQGKVLREPGTGKGLVIIEGQQFPFSLNDVWQSPQPPKIGMIVEAEFNRDGKLVGIRALDAKSRPA